MTCERFLSKNLSVNLPAPYRRERLLQQCASFVPPFSFIFQLNTNYILSIGNKISFAHSLPAEEEEQERSIFLWLSRIRRMRVNQNPDFPGSARHVILTVKGAAENRSLFAVGGPGASERGVKKNHDLIRNLKSWFFSRTERPRCSLVTFLTLRK